MSISNTEQLEFEMRQRCRGRYIQTGRDDQLLGYINRLLQNAKDLRCGREGSRRRSLFVIGESGSGKTRSLRYHLERIPEFLPYENEYGETVHPLICIEAPKPCTLKALATALLEKIGVPVGSRTPEHALFRLLKEQLKERGVKALWIDEMQHALRSNTPKAILDVQDVLKSLVQFESWPLHTIYSGVPALSAFLAGDRQLANRSYVMRFEPLEYPDDVEWINKIVRTIATEDCGLNLAEGVTTDEFSEKLCQASGGAFGLLIEQVQEACFHAVAKGRKQLTLRDFSRTYSDATGCEQRDNIFIAHNWRDVRPQNALADLYPEDLNQNRREK